MSAAGRAAPKKYLQLRLLQVRALTEVLDEGSDNEGWDGWPIERVLTPPIRPFKSRRLAGRRDSSAGETVCPCIVEIDRRVHNAESAGVVATTLLASWSIDLIN